MKKPKKEKRPTHKALVKDTLNDTIQTLELTIRCARRCAYDLKHAAGYLSLYGEREKEMARMFEERGSYYVKLFQSGSECKNYRHRLHHTIEEHERTIAKLQAILAEHNIADPTILGF